MATARAGAVGAISAVLGLSIGAAGWLQPVVTARAVTAPITVVTIGFDDGTADQFNVLPVLDKHGMHATFFINSGFIGDPDHMTVDQLKTLAAHGNEIGGHTVDHANIQPLSLADATAEVCNDRATRVGWGFDPTSFAYPFGSYDATSEQVVASCG